jgi:hypothetical protein
MGSSVGTELVVRLVWAEADDERGDRVPDNLGAVVSTRSVFTVLLTSDIYHVISEVITS